MRIKHSVMITLETLLLPVAILLSLATPAAADDWPRWGGSSGDFVVVSAGPLAESWPEGRPKVLWRRPWPLIRRGDWIYGSIGGNRVSFLAAVRWKDGHVAWRERGFHKAQTLWADGKLLFLTEDGELVLARVSPEGLEVLAKSKVTEKVSWTLPTLVGSTLYLRDQKDALALDLGRGPGKPGDN